MDGWSVFMWAAVVGVGVFAAVLLAGLGGTSYYVLTQLLPVR